MQILLHLSAFLLTIYSICVKRTRMKGISRILKCHKSRSEEKRAEDLAVRYWEAHRSQVHAVLWRQWRWKLIMKPASLPRHARPAPLSILRMCLLVKFVILFSAEAQSISTSFRLKYTYRMKSKGVNRSF